MADLLVDTDVQKTATRWSDVRKLNALEPAITCVQKHGQLFQTLRSMRERFDDIVIDAGGQDSPELRAALVGADVLISPVRATQCDLWTLEAMSELVEHARAMNPELDARLLLSLCSTNPSVTAAKSARALLAEYPAFGAFRTEIRDRKAFQDAMFLGKSVLEMSDAKATSEMTAFFEELTHARAIREAEAV